MTGQRYRALLIGNARYPEDPEHLSPLEGPPNDVAAMRSALAHPEFGMFTAEHIRVRTELPSHELTEELAEFFGDAERDDLLLLYYSGHGRLDEHGGLNLCAGDTRTGSLMSTALAADQLNDVIEGSAAGTIVVILDCCHSGAFQGAVDIATPLAPPTGRGRYVLAACRAAQPAQDADGPGSLSAFTHHLVAALAGHAQQAAEDGFLSLDDVYEHLRRELRITSFQTPIRKVTSDGGIRIARARQRRSPLAVDPPAVLAEDADPAEALTVPQRMLGDLLGYVPEARQAVLVGADGFPIAASGPVSHDDLDRLAAAIMGLGLGGRHLATLSRSTVRQIVADFDAGLLTVNILPDGRSLALYAAGSADLGTVMYQVSLTAEKLAGEPAPTRWLVHPRFKGGGSPAEQDVVGVILNGLTTRVHGLTGCLAASVDGHALGTSDGFPYDSGAAAAISCSLFGSARAVSALLNAGTVRQVVVETSAGPAVLTPLGENSVLAQFLDQSADLGISGYEAALVGTRAGGVLSPGRRSDSS